ncbi:MAG: ribonuclease HI family protein [Ignavibacteria bacterium]|nr:ribonuclease HI family protein [Ignavibacteria bacterium]
MVKKIKVYTDATAKGNPGPSGLGIVIKDESDEILLTHKEYIGKATNNQGEYTALLKSLTLLKNLQTEYDFVEFYSDSLLMVSQLTGKYKIKDKYLMRNAMNFWEGINKLDKKHSITYIPREQNSIADKLANEATKEGMLAEAQK